jgi:hypothetical protein
MQASCFYCNINQLQCETLDKKTFNIEPHDVTMFAYICYWQVCGHYGVGETLSSKVMCHFLHYKL